MDTTLNGVWHLLQCTALIYALDGLKMQAEVVKDEEFCFSKLSTITTISVNMHLQKPLHSLIVDGLGLYLV